MATSVPVSQRSDAEPSFDALADRFLAALAAQHFARLEACFSPDVRFRALTPNHVWANFGAAGAMGAYHNWFADATPFTLVSTSVSQIGGRLSLACRFRAAENAGAPLSLVEQHLYATVSDDRLADVALVCSGYQPVPGDSA